MVGHWASVLLLLSPKSSRSLKSATATSSRRGFRLAQAPFFSIPAYLNVTIAGSSGQESSLFFNPPPSCPFLNCRCPTFRVYLAPLSSNS
ncbi:hypothetical protein GE09DRAFT_582506 [Coniochaeta sp. 2T2.1]|nr:hypothetical protein GE09DRAFT_582506 [Coniochaeta sp. 2T2.1]